MKDKNITNYDWIKPGARVRIKTVKQIQEVYGDSMPYSLTYRMQNLCGTIQVIDCVNTSNSTSCKMCVHIDGWNWPEGALLPAITSKGNIL